MEEPVVKTNKYSIGKYLRKKKGIHKKDPEAKIIQPSESLQEYINHLKENGLVTKKLAYAQFKLQNGLPYPGLVATEKIITDEIIVQVPRKLILSTKKAFFSDINHIFVENPKFFSPSQASMWEDHVLLVFLLYEHQKGQKSQWYHLINNLPKDIDYLVFWDQEEIKMLEDVTLERLTKRRRKQYDSAESFVVELGKRYPDLLDPKVFTPENVRWIYTHLITRCFGKYFEYIVMVPFAELFNHDCSDVYYDLEYFKGNPNMPSDYSMDDPKEVPEEEIEDYETSEGSYDSQDAEFDSDFEYDNEDFIKGKDKHRGNDKFQEDESLFTGEINSKIVEIEDTLMKKFDWTDGFSLFFVKEMHKEARALLDNYNTKKITINSAKASLKTLETSLATFEKETRKFYKDVYNLTAKEVETSIKEKQVQSAKKTKEDTKKCDAEPEKSDKPAFPPYDQWKDDTFDNFVMKCSWKDQFEAGSQVYFCYGRLSNRLNLLRYGISIAYNKYEHVYMKVPYLKNFKDTPWVVKKCMEFKLSRYMRFKLKRTCVNINFINFWKGSAFSLKKHGCESLMNSSNIALEIKAVEKACEYLEGFLDTFNKTPEEYKQIIQDPQTGYHKYFAAVFCLEKHRLVSFHLKALRVLEEILQRLKGGMEFNEAIKRVEEFEDEDQALRNRVFLSKYLDRMETASSNK